MRDYAERDRINREAHAPYMACKQTARLNEERLAQQRDGERRNREAYQRNLEQNMAARQREQMEREREMEQSRQARVIASTPAPSYSNQARVVQTPQYQVQQQAQAEQNRQQQRVQEAQALSDAFKNLRQAFKQGQQTGATNAAGTSAAMAETNAAVNAGRGGSPVVGAVGGSALAATGGRNAQTMNTLDSTLKQMDQVGANNSSGTSLASNNYRQASSATPAANHPSGDSNATAGASPETACGNRVFLALQRCIVKQCELPQFANHPQCKNLNSSSSSSESGNTHNSITSNTPEQSGSAAANHKDRQPTSVASVTSNPPVANAVVSAAPVASPEDACGKRVFLALQRCIAKQCENPQFAGHAQCKALSSNTNSVSSGDKN